jgi:hypothetical protein
MVRRPAAEMRQLIAGLMSRDDTAGNDRFQRDNAKFSSRCVMATATRGTQLSTGSATATANCGRRVNEPNCHRLQPAGVEVVSC